MSREIKFRGRRVDNGAWVYGFYYTFKAAGQTIAAVMEELGSTYMVDPETVGQYTGLKDEEGTEIYESDQLYAPGNLTDELEYVGDVVWDEDDARWEVASFHGRFEYIPSGCVVRGNIYENPELVVEVPHV